MRFAGSGAEPPAFAHKIYLRRLRQCRSIDRCIPWSKRYPTWLTRSGYSASRNAGTIVDIVSADPQCGIVVPGTGGLRKLRVAASGRGKRGGARVIYLFGGDRVPVFLLAAFAKNEKSDLSPAERHKLARMTAELIRNYGANNE